MFSRGFVTFQFKLINYGTNVRSELGIKNKLITLMEVKTRIPISIVDI